MIDILWTIIAALISAIASAIFKKIANGLTRNEDRFETKPVIESPKAQGRIDISVLVSIEGASEQVSDGKVMISIKEG